MRRRFLTAVVLAIADLLVAWSCTPYGVELNQVASCVVTESLVSYVEGYNSVTKSRLFERHGRDIFEECWEAEHPQGPR